MPKGTEETARNLKLKRRAEALQARYGGIIKQIKLALDNMGDGYISADLAKGRVSVTEILPGMVLEDLPAGAVLVCCGGVSRRRRGAPFTFLVERTSGISTPLGPQDATSTLLSEALRKDPSTAVPTGKVQPDGNSGLPDQVRPKGKLE